MVEGLREIREVIDQSKTQWHTRTLTFTHSEEKNQQLVLNKYKSQRERKSPKASMIEVRLKPLEYKSSRHEQWNHATLLL